MFDLARFLRLARAQWAEQRRAYAWFLGVGVIVHFVLLLVLVSVGRDIQVFTVDGQQWVYFAGLFVSAPLFAARYFQAMARRESAYLLLMRPASLLEKWLLAILVVAVMYPVAYSLAFYLCNAPAALYAQAEVASDAAMRLKDGAYDRFDSLKTPQGRYGLYLPWREFDSWRPVIGVVLHLSIWQAFAVLGSLYFRSFTALKSVVVAFVLMLLLLLVGAVGGGYPDRFLGFWSSGRALANGQQWLFLIAWFAIPGLLWLASLFALADREEA